MKKTKKLRIQNGITLMALVITIIVLLILSAVAIASLKHFGILDKAKFAKSRYSDAQNEEEQKLNEFEKQMGGDETTIDAAEVAFTPENNISLLGEINKIQESGYTNIEITGMLNDRTEKTEKYNLHTIVYDGDLVLDGKTDVIGATLYDQDEKYIYEFGDATSDVAISSNIEDENYYAQNMVVLKVNGNLTINENVVLTACKSSN